MTAAEPPALRQRLLRRVLPVVVTTLTLGWVAYSFDMGKVAAALSWHVVVLIVPSLLAYGAVTLVIEAWSLLRVIGDPPPGFGLPAAWRTPAVLSAPRRIARMGRRGWPVQHRQHTGVADRRRG